MHYINFESNNQFKPDLFSCQIFIQRIEFFIYSIAISLAFVEIVQNCQLISNQRANHKYLESYLYFGDDTKFCKEADFRF